MPEQYGLKLFCPYRFITLPPNQHLRRQPWVDKPTQSILIRRSTGGEGLRTLPVSLKYDVGILQNLLLGEIWFPIIVAFFERLTIYTNSRCGKCEVRLYWCLTRFQDWIRVSRSAWCHLNFQTTISDYQERWISRSTDPTSAYRYHEKHQHPPCGA